jgi:DnaJ-domain-containing protein 1
MFRLWPFFIWLVYLILPYDLVPDFLPGFGWSEDLLILAAIYWWWRKRQQAFATESPNDHARQHDAAGAGEQAGGQSGNRQQGGGRSDSRQQARDPYKILGVTRPARLEQIKHAYRLQASRYHPDKVSHLGEEFQTLAKEKFQDIQWAYEQLLKEYRA